MQYEYNSPASAIHLGDIPLLAPANAEPWKPVEPEGGATLWRYMSFAKFCSLLDRQALFFSLVGEMDDHYEGFISPPYVRAEGDVLTITEQAVHSLLHKASRSSLINC